MFLKLIAVCIFYKVIYLSEDGELNRAGREASLCNSFIINVKETHFIYHF